jgi:hypothetical protein
MPVILALALMLPAIAQAGDSLAQLEQQIGAVLGHQANIGTSLLREQGHLLAAERELERLSAELEKTDALGAALLDELHRLRALSAKAFGARPTM